LGKREGERALVVKQECAEDYQEEKGWQRCAERESLNWNRPGKNKDAALQRTSRRYSNYEKKKGNGKGKRGGEREFEFGGKINRKGIGKKKQQAKWTIRNGQKKCARKKKPRAGWKYWVKKRTIEEKKGRGSAKA